MNMMYSAGLMLALMAFLIAVPGGLLVAFRIFASRQLRDDPTPAAREAPRSPAP